MSDDTQQVKDWIDEQRRIMSPRRSLNPGVYEISDTLVVGQSMGLKLCGAGGQNRSTSPGWDRFRCGTILEWTGPPDKPVMEIIGCTGLVIEGINITVPDDQDAAQCILIRDAAGSLNMAFRDCGFIGGQVGIQCGTLATEQTCANLTWDNCHWERQKQAAYRVVNVQSLEHLFLRPQFAFTPLAWDVQAGGDITSVGGGSYEVGCLLKVGAVSENTRSFDINSLRVDGSKTRTAWLDAYDTGSARTYGVVSFRNCGQNKAQLTSDRPLFTVPPGCRCVADCCDFSGSKHDWARVYSDNRAGGELIATYCSGLDGTRLSELVTLKGNRAAADFFRCGNLYSRTGDWSSREVA